MTGRAHSAVRAAWTALAAALLAGCAPAPGPDAVTFVRGGLVVPASEAGTPLPDGRRLVPRDWAPGVLVHPPAGPAVRAPEHPTLVAWWSHPLHTAGVTDAGAGLPDTALAFSPDSRSLAVASESGELLVFDAATGRVRWHRMLTAGLYKSLAFAADGALLFAGEQSRAAALVAFDANTGAEAWRADLRPLLDADDAPRVTGRYARYALPAALKLVPLAGGGVVAAATQSWSAGDGWARRSRLVRVDADGNTRWRFPAERALHQSVVTVATDAAAQRYVAFAANGTPPAPGPLATTGVGVLDTATGRWLGGHAFAALTANPPEAYIWEGLALAPDGARGVVGLTDGRAFTFGLPPARDTLVEHDVGAAVHVAGQPVVAGAGYALATPRALYVQTNDSRIGAWGGGGPSVRAPAPHPDAGTIWRFAGGAPAGRYRGPFTCNSFAASADGAVVATVTTPPYEANPHARHGLLLLDATGPALQPLAHFPTAGPAFFRPAVAPDGFFVAVVECPGYDPTTRTRYGRYQVHLLH